ncbi:MAG: alkaline phosphatase family protein [Vicinamibacteria bacterium]
MPQAPHSVEAVREELKRLGYLASGLDRFVLAGATAPSPLRASLAAATRVGVLGGVVLGVALTLAAASLDPRAFARPRDLAVLALYLALATGLATGLLAFLAGLLATTLARRAAPRGAAELPRLAGLGLALAGLGYLALWWRSHGFGPASPALQAGFAALGIAVSLLLWRFGTLAAVAVLSASGGRVAEAALSRRAALPLVAAAALVFAAGLAAAGWLERQTPQAPDFAVVPTGLRVRVVGIDGLERALAEQMVARGELPALAALLAEGARGTLVGEPERVPAIVWTTLATGRGPEAHGIRSAGARRLAGISSPVVLSEGSALESSLARAADLLRLGRTEPASAVLRGAKTFWNVASEKGLRVGIVNWWATWPADGVNGYLVSERAFFKLERGGPADREVYPPEAFARLRGLLPPAGERALRLDAFSAAAARALREPRPPDLEAVYLNGLDILEEQRLGDSAPHDVASLDQALEAVRAHLRSTDRLLGELLADRAPSEVVVLVADAGRVPRRTNHAPEGLIVLAGGPIVRADLGRVGSRDIAPSVLHLLGLPKSDELTGRVLEAALGSAFRAAHPVRTVPSYGRRRAARPAQSAFDRDMVEELRALGYIN